MCRLPPSRARQRPTYGPLHSRTQSAPNSIGPGESDLVQRLDAETLRGARHHAAAERTVELGRRIVVGQRPHHHAAQAALAEVAAGGGEQAAAETQSLKLGAQ